MTANAAATWVAVTPFADVVAEKKNRLASPTWNMPSPSWLVSRADMSRRKPGSRPRSRRSVRTVARGAGTSGSVGTTGTA